jgi:hypothetical protein
VAYIGESTKILFPLKLTGEGYTGDSRLTSAAYTGESRLPGVAYTSESTVQPSRPAKLKKWSYYLDNFYDFTHSGWTMFLF